MCQKAWAATMTTLITKNCRACSQAIAKSSNTRWVKSLLGGEPLKEAMEKGAASQLEPVDDDADDDDLHEDGEDESVDLVDQEPEAREEAPVFVVASPEKPQVSNSSKVQFLYGFQYNADQSVSAWRVDASCPSPAENKEYTRDISHEANQAVAYWKDGHKAVIKGLEGNAAKKTPPPNIEMQQRVSRKRPAAAMRQGAIVKYKKDKVGLWQILVEGKARCQLTQKHFGETESDIEKAKQLLQALADKFNAGELKEDQLHRARDDELARIGARGAGRRTRWPKVLLEEKTSGESKKKQCDDKGYAVVGKLFSGPPDLPGLF